MIRSDQFLEGYKACSTGSSRTRNPYKQLPSNTENDEMRVEWNLGWHKRFFNEAIDSEP